MEPVFHQDRKDTEPEAGCWLSLGEDNNGHQDHLGSMGKAESSRSRVCVEDQSTPGRGRGEVGKSDKKPFPGDPGKDIQGQLAAVHEPAAVSLTVCS